MRRHEEAVLMSQGKRLNRTSIEGALELLTGPPQLVVVDRRILDLIMGDLAPLIILRDLGNDRRMGPALAEMYIWDEDEPC